MTPVLFYAPGDVVIVPGVAARQLAKGMKKMMNEAVRRDGATFDEVTWDVVEAFMAARGVTTGVDAAIATPVDTALTSANVTDVVPVLIEEELNLAQAAKITGRTRQGLWARIDRGTLVGRKDEQGQWWVRKTDLVPKETEPEAR